MSEQVLNGPRIQVLNSRGAPVQNQTIIPPMPVSDEASLTQLVSWAQGVATPPEPYREEATQTQSAKILDIMILYIIMNIHCFIIYNHDSYRRMGVLDLARAP